MIPADDFDAAGGEGGEEFEIAIYMVVVGAIGWVREVSLLFIERGCEFQFNPRIVVTEIIIIFVSAGLEEVDSEKLHTVQTRALRLVQLSAHNGVSFTLIIYASELTTYKPLSHIDHRAI